MPPVFDIACFGTSLTTGPSSGDWPLNLEAMLRPGADEKIRTYTLGAPGQTSAWGASNVGPVARTHARVVVIEFLMNDAWEGSGISVPQSRANHLAIVNAIRAESPSTLIYLQTMNPTVGRTDRPNHAAYNAMYAELAGTEGLGFINHWQNWSGATAVDMPDGIHPTAAALKARTLPLLVSTLGPLLSS